MIADAIPQMSPGRSVISTKRADAGNGGPLM